MANIKLCEVCGLRYATIYPYQLCVSCFRGYIELLPCHECLIRDDEPMIETETDSGIIEKYHEKCWQIRADKFSRGEVGPEYKRCADCDKELAPTVKGDICRTCDFKRLRAS